MTQPNRSRLGALFASSLRRASGDMTAYNRELHDEFWQSCPDFARYNPGARHRRRRIVSWVRSLRPRSVLDVGCGNGELLRLLRAVLPVETTFAGADLSPVTIAQDARELPFAAFHVLNVERSSLQDRFELVVCSEVIEHLHDQTTAVTHLGRMLQPGGHLILTCPTGKLHQTEQVFGHTTHPRPEELGSMIRHAGLALLALENWGWPVYVSVKYATNLHAEAALKKFGTGAYSPAAKALCHVLYAASFVGPRSSRYGCQLFALARRPP